MSRLAALLLVLLTGCQHTLTVGDREVPACFVDETQWSLQRRELRLIQKEIDRSIELDGAEFKYPPTEFIIWDRHELPVSWLPRPNWLVGYWWARDGQSIIHVTSPKIVRHELHHARTGPGHDGDKWDEIENERFAD